MRRWKSDGGTDVREDELWEQGLEMWDIVHGNECLVVEKE
jgi:hypothetical protein